MHGYRDRPNDYDSVSKCTSLGYLTPRLSLNITLIPQTSGTNSVRYTSRTHLINLESYTVSSITSLIYLSTQLICVQYISPR